MTFFKGIVPCGVCSAPVKTNQRRVQCDVCATWLHTRCIGVSSDEYVELQRSDDPWCCRRCLKEALPFFDVSSSDSLFDVSAPTSLTVMYTNCRSLLPKLDHLRLLASTHAPHVMHSLRLGSTIPSLIVKPASPITNLFARIGTDMEVA